MLVCNSDALGEMVFLVTDEIILLVFWDRVSDLWLLLDSILSCPGAQFINSLQEDNFINSIWCIGLALV